MASRNCARRITGGPPPPRASRYGARSGPPQVPLPCPLPKTDSGTGRSLRPDGGLKPISQLRHRLITDANYRRAKPKPPNTNNTASTISSTKSQTGISFPLLAAKESSTPFLIPQITARQTPKSRNPCEEGATLPRYPRHRSAVQNAEGVWRSLGPLEIIGQLGSPSHSCSEMARVSGSGAA